MAEQTKEKENICIRRPKSFRCDQEYAGADASYGFDHILVPPYRHLRELGSGSFGVVILAQDNVTKEFVVIKYFKRDDNTGRRLAAREVAMLRLIKGSRSSKCPPSLPCYKRHFYDTKRERFAIVQSFSRGATVQQWLVDRDPGDITQLSREQIKGAFSPFVIDILTALRYLHKRDIIHGDVKPDNMSINPETKKSMLLDIGGSCVAREKTGFVASCYTNRPAWTPSYASPAIYQEYSMRKTMTKEVGQKGDMWAFGLSLVHAVSFQRTFRDIRVIETFLSRHIMEEEKQLYSLMGALLKTNDDERPGASAALLRMRAPSQRPVDTVVTLGPYWAQGKRRVITIAGHPKAKSKKSSTSSTQQTRRASDATLAQTSLTSKSRTGR